MATEAEVQAALDDLDRAPDRIVARNWPGHLQARSADPGLYSWWVDPAGADELAEGLDASVEAGRIYAGQAGATKWPSGKVGAATLASRIGSQHVRGRIRGSTFRLTLASALRASLGPVVEGPKKLAGESEDELSRWIAGHLTVAVHPFAERDALSDLEDRVLDVLDPPLNLDGRPPSDVRSSLSRRRASLGAATAPPSPSRARSQPTVPSKPMTAAGSSERVTLHEEIAAILREQGGWMTTQEIAHAVNERGRYSKKDGSAMAASQIRIRTYKYSHLFEQDGSRVRLRD